MNAWTESLNLPDKVNARWMRTLAIGDNAALLNVHRLAKVHRVNDFGVLASSAELVLKVVVEE